MKIKNASRRLWMRRQRQKKRRESCAKNTQPKPDPPNGTHMTVPRAIATYPSFPERRFPTTMSATTTTTRNTIKSHKGRSTKYTTSTPAPPDGMHMIVFIGITTYQSLPDRRLPMTMNAKTMITNNTRKLHKGHSTHAHSSHQEAYDISQRDYDQTIHYQKVIPNNYDRNNDNY